MAGPRTTQRIALAIVAAGLAVGPLAAAAIAQDEDPVDQPPPDPAVVLETLAFYTGELMDADFDGDGVADITDSDGDGIPDIPPGEPGERDIVPGDTLFMQEITEELQAQGLDTLVTNDSGSDLQGDCGGMALSFDADGQLLDMAIGIPSNEGGGPRGQLIDVWGDEFGERAFTENNPFVVDTKVIYIGTLPREDDGALEHNWTIKTAGISLDKGGDPNPNGKNRNIGEVELDSIPDVLRPAGIFPIKGELTSQNGLTCMADGWIRFEGGNPLLTAPSAVAAVLGGAGIIGLLFNARPAMTWKA